MSFRDTFTRNSNSSQNLRYDDNAAYHFYITILILVVMPLAYNIIKTILNPFSHIPTLSDLEKKRQFRDKISKFKKENKYAYITFKFVLKIALLLFIVYGIVICTRTIMDSKQEIKGFDPYEILEVDPSAPIQKIKKAYRKLALLYHPDRNPDNPEASAKFIIISKAYECLTDQEAKEKCLKYGNPDGAASFNVGIALPEFLVKKENHLAIMGIIFVLVVIILPIYLIQYHSQINKYDDFGVLVESVQLINYTINQQFSMKDTIKMIACCAQFANMPTTSDQVPKLESLLKQLDEDQRKNLTKKNYKGFIKKALLLIDARMNQKSIPKELQEDFKMIMKKTPVVIKSAINSACERSVQYVKAQPYFVGKNCIKSLILFQQYFIQGKSYEDSDSFIQLDLSGEQVQKINKKKKTKKITDLKTLMTKNQERDYFLSLLDGNRSAFIKECIEYYPFVEVECDFKVEDETVIGAHDFFQIVINVKSNRLGNFCSAVTYPFLKMEGWHVIVSETNSIATMFHEFFTFDELTKTFKITAKQDKAGKYSLTVCIMSDSYFGLDIEKDFKYEVTAIKPERTIVEKDEDLLQKSYLQKMMENLMPQEEQQVSDKEDEPEKKQVQKKQVQKKQ